MREMTKFGADLIQAMSEALAHAQGKDVAASRCAVRKLAPWTQKPCARSSI